MQKTAYDVRISDWSSDVCSSDLRVGGLGGPGHARCAGAELEGLQPSAAIDGEALGRARLPFYDQPCAARILNNRRGRAAVGGIDRLLQTDEAVVVGRSEEHTSELQSLMRISYAVFRLKKKNKHTRQMT